MNLNDLLLLGGFGAAGLTAITFKVEAFTFTQALMEDNTLRRVAAIQYYFGLRRIWISTSALSDFLLMFYDSPSGWGKAAGIAAVIGFCIVYRPIALRSGARTARLAFVRKASCELENNGVPPTEAFLQAEPQFAARLEMK